MYRILSTYHSGKTIYYTSYYKKNRSRLLRHTVILAKSAFKKVFSSWTTSTYFCETCVKLEKPPVINPGKYSQIGD